MCILGGELPDGTEVKSATAKIARSRLAAEFGEVDCWRRDRMKPSAFGVTKKRSSLFQYGALTARGTAGITFFPKLSKKMKSKKMRFLRK